MSVYPISAKFRNCSATSSIRVPPTLLWVDPFPDSSGWPGLSRRAGRLGDDGAQFDRDDQLRGCGFPDLHALWSCFLRAYDAASWANTIILAHRTSTAAGSESTQARDREP